MHHSKELASAFIIMFGFFLAVLFPLIITAHYLWPTSLHWPVFMLKNYTI